MAARPSLEDLLEDIPPEKLNQPCRDDHLNKLALSLTDWQSIAPFLGLTKADEEEIKRDYSNTKTQKIAMLRKWKEKIWRQAKYKKLAKVFWELEQTDLVEKVCELLQTESSSSSSDEEFFDAVEEQFETNTSVAGGEDINIAVLYSPANKSGAEQVDTLVDKEDLSATAKQGPKSILDLYAEYLRGRYSTELPKFFTLQWPPPPTRKVFNLAIIGHQTIQRGPIDEELVRLTLRGDIDEVMERKSPIELKNLFKLDNSRHKVVLIEGAPGAGKSTLAWYICQKWESGELFQEFKVVVFVQLRDPPIQSATSLADILPVKSEQMRTQIVSELEPLNGQGVLFVLDGWDEYGTGLRAHSLFQQLICSPEQVNMHFSSLIITSRPIASGELQRYASSRVEIVGFTSAEVKKYFNESIGDSGTEQKFHDHLRECPVIEASCYLPLNAAIVVHLFLVLNHTLPHTLHEVFLSLVICCIIRHLTRQAGEGKEIPDISSLDDLPPEVQEPFSNICAMAFHGVMKNKATFSAMDLRSFNLPTELNTLSLIQGAQSFTAFKTSISWNFLHLSVQELLGAFHISKLPPAEQIKIFNDLLGQPRLAAVFRFYAAFTKLQTEGVRDIVARIVQKQEKPLLVHLLHGLYEAQDVSLCEFVASHLNGKLDLQTSSLSPMDCLVVGYFLFCVCLATSREFKVDLSHCSLDEYRISLLVRELSKCSSFLKPLLILNLSDNDLSHGAIVYIAEILRHTNCLKTLDIFRCGMGDQSMKPLASVLEMNGSLEVLGLSRNHGLTGIGLMALGESLKRNRGLKGLYLSGCGIGDQGMKSLASALEMNGSLEELSLSENFAVTGIGLMALGESLKRNRGLKGLYLSYCGIDDQGMESLASALEMNGSLEELDLTGNRAVTGIGLMALGEGLKKNRGLKRLNLSHCGIDDQGMKSLASVLEMNGSLEVLDLSWNDAVTGIGLTALGESLERNRGLRRLNLSHCGIDDQGMKSLASVLEMNGSLEVLDLSGNYAVTDSGLNALGESLKRNRSLKKLSLSGLGLRIISGNDWKQFIVCLEENNHLKELVLQYSSTCELIQETEAVNQIRRQKNLPLLVLTSRPLNY